MDKMATKGPMYRERVVPKWTSFLPVLLIFPTFWLTWAPINLIVGIGAGIVSTVATVWFMLAKSPVITLENSQICVGKAKIDLKHVGSVQIAPKGPRLAARVPNLDPRAYLSLQNSIPGLIKLEITDNQDPTPYWICSTRQPEHLVSAIERAKSTLKKAKD